MTAIIVLLGGDARSGAAEQHVRATAWRMGFDTLAETTLNRLELAKIEPRIATAQHAWLRTGGTDDAQTGHVELIALYDALPVPPLEKHRMKYPEIDNARVAQFWERLNFSLPRRLSSNAWAFSVLISSDAAAALGDIVFGNVFNVSMKERVEASDDFRNPSHVVQPLSVLGERARVDLVEYDGRVAVRKTFRPGRQRYFERELFALKELSQEISQIPMLLGHGADYVVMERYEDRLRLDGHRLNVARRLIPLRLGDAMIATVRAFYDRGYSLLDCHPGHFLFDASGEVKVIDFEFLHRYESKPERFEESFDFTGVKTDVDEIDIPSVLNKNPYQHYWYPHLGLELKTMLHGSQISRRLGRVEHWARRYALRAARPALRQLRRSGLPRRV